MGDGNPWCDPGVARQQRELVDRQLAEGGWLHFETFAQAVRATQCTGVIAEFGCASGYGREILDRAGVQYARYTGLDINDAALAIARERYPESDWANPEREKIVGQADIVIDGCALMHVEEWRDHLARLCAASRRWVILHRVPIDPITERTTTTGYGKTFPAWKFAPSEIAAEMKRHGFETVRDFRADAESVTFLFARARHWATYCDSAYLPRLKALHASMQRHCAPFVLHVLAWDDKTWHACAAGSELDGVRVTMADEHNFFKAHPELAIDRLPGPPRSRVEHMWTCGPQWIADVMEKTGEPVTYVDADCYAFSSPELMFAEIGGAPAAFVGHNFAKATDGLPGPTIETHGAFGALNVGVCYFADPEIAQEWARRCREWCFDRVELVEAHGGPVPITDRRLRYGDQAYLQDLAQERPDIHVVQNVAAMVGPWNLHTRALDVRDAVIHFANRPLGFYHFSSLKLLPHGDWQPTRPEYQLTQRQIEIIYRPYLAALKETR